ncbi:Hypothetical predicted protein [Marmota monax]|uniref:Cytosolic endo-beta-N-acetylglucosaminidase C-terminal domain-containing protein n=1 Tax=Marmota monax TaxID=9995 RepID=A0A5E4C3P2_MARMO|nr:Hypothetical predicted protein [Marmota monax]
MPPSPAETGSRQSLQPLQVPPTKLARWAGRCGQPLSGGWIQRCYEVSLRGCLLQDLFVNFSRPPGSRKEESFACRLGEIQVVDADSLLAPLHQVQDVTVSQVRCFRVHCWEGTRSDSPSREPAGPEKPTFLGLAFANQYRVVDLVVEAAGPGQDGRVEFLVEPVPREGFLVPQAEWGRAALLYSSPR